MSYMSVVTERYIRTLHCRISRGPQHTRRSQRLPREHGTERTKLLFGEGLEWAKVHNSVNVVGIEVRLWSNGVEACGGRSSRGINERLHFVLQVDRGGAHLIA